MWANNQLGSSFMTKIEGKQGNLLTVNYKAEDIVALLLDERGPLMESSLIRKLKVRFGYPGLERGNFYRHHFYLFHALYRIKHSTAYRDFYLHINTLHVRMLRLPEHGECAFYFPFTGTFCKRSCDGRVCHKHGYGTDSIVADYLSSFYLEKENVELFDEDSLKERTEKILLYGLGKRHIDNSLSFFGLKDFDEKKIRRCYRSMAVACHPDKGGSTEKMREVNQHYQVLKPLFNLS